MAKELYLYTSIYSYVAEFLISQMEEFKSQDIILRVNSAGGAVLPAFGIARKMREIGGVTIKVDGAALSMAADLLPYADKVIALDVSRFLVHRADGPVRTPEDQKSLDSLNADLRSKFEKKVNSEKFKEVTGYSLDDVFDPTRRLDVWLTAAQAKEVGLVDEIVALDPMEVTALEEKFFGIAASAKPPVEKSQIQNSDKMTLEEIKAKHPDVFNQIVALGIAQERDRVGAWMAFVDVDPEGVSKSVKEGTALSMTQMTELTIKKVSGAKLETLKKETTTTVETTEVEKKEKTDAEKTKEKFVTDVKAMVKSNM